VTDYQRKLYAFLQASLPHPNDQLPDPFRQLACWGNLDELRDWWAQGQIARDIGASSDRINLQVKSHLPNDIEVRHPISGQQQTITPPDVEVVIPPEIQISTDEKQVFWWFWRFYPEYLAKANPNSQALLYPAHRILPDCPLHSYQSTVSALVGALANQNAEKPEDRVPYLLLFSFSPVQDFIKASRKFLDFWAGSYLLHYLSARLCWHVAQKYGPDAIIVPSLWNQEIFDALMLQDDGFKSFEEYFRAIAPEDSEHKTPVERFNNHESNSLSTAGFPNMITVLVPGKAAAAELGQELADELVALWHDVKKKDGKGKTVVVRKGFGAKVREKIQEQVIAYLTTTENLAGATYDDKRQTRLKLLEAEGPEALLDTERCNLLLQEAFPTLSEKQREPYRQELEKLVRESNWEWGHLWDAQLGNTWEPYWAAVPLGNPDQALSETDTTNYKKWAQKQDEIAWPLTPLPTEAETAVYTQELNVGTWWGSLQQRLRTAHMAVKNTRHWQIPAAPGPRSSLSGQFSAVHPRLNYQEKQVRDRTTQTFVTRDFREGGGLPDSSMRLFWLLMSYAYKGLFNGSEMLNALELTKRMAWQFGGVAESLGISTTLPVLKAEDYDEEDQSALHLQESSSEIDYEQLIRFPNLSSIAAARFMYESYDQPNSKLRAYWRVLRQKISSGFENSQHQAQFAARTRGRPTHVWKTDNRINPSQAQKGQNYNGVMFSSKWLADDLNLEKHSENGDGNEVATLRRLVDEAHRHEDVNFGDGSPGDWWVIVLGDGDGMGNYISGEELKAYRRYVNSGAIDKSNLDKENHQRQRDQLANFLKNTPKRMGPATHIGLNRALLDFSNRLVPYLTEKRYCGRVIYSGGDDVMAVLPLEDLPGYVRSLRAAWSGKADPEAEFTSDGGYWHPKDSVKGVPQRPHFTMGKDATMSLGIVIANKSVPLPTVLDHLWDAEQTAKAMPGKDGLCFRVIFGGGNTLEALMKGHLLDDWWALVNHGGEELSPLLYRLAEELPRRASITSDCYLFAEAAKVIVKNRDESRHTPNFEQFCTVLNQWLRDWEDWARDAIKNSPPGYATPAGTRPEDLGYLLRFSAFWVSKNAQRQAWVQPVEVKS
jgi:CRISPR-associated protein Cmr2